MPQSILTGGATSSATVTVTVNNGTGTYAGAAGTFKLTGSVTGDILSGYKLNNFSGAGTLTTGGTVTPPPAAGPTITAVQDAASNTANIAQGSIFIVKGTNLSASGYTPYNPPRPTVSSGGIKVTFTPVAGGAGTDAYLVYLYNQSGVNQIAAILPSTVAVGNYNVTVTNGTVSAPVTAQVVANKVALFTQDSTGSGLASVQNYISAGVVDLNRLTTGSVGGVTISPAKPGQPVIAYGTGLGAYAAGDNTASPAFDFRASETIVAVVGGVNIPVDYAGRAGYAGEDQINFTLPGNIPTGCAVSLQISVNGKLSAPTSISIAPDANSSACVFPGYTTAQLQKLDNGGTITAGGFSITQFSISVPPIGNAKFDAVGGGFSQLTGFQLASAAQANVNVIQSGSCQVITVTSGSGSATSGGSLTYLDAGTVTINGPAGSSLTNQALTKTKNLYSYSTTEGLSLPGQANFTLPAGTYTLKRRGRQRRGIFQQRPTEPGLSAYCHGRLARLGAEEFGTDAQLDRRQFLRSGGDRRRFLDHFGYGDQRGHHYDRVPLSHDGGTADVHRAGFDSQPVAGDDHRHARSGVRHQPDGVYGALKGGRLEHRQRLLELRRSRRHGRISVELPAVRQAESEADPPACAGRGPATHVCTSSFDSELRSAGRFGCGRVVPDDGPDAADGLEQLGFLRHRCYRGGGQGQCRLHG